MFTTRRPRRVPNSTAPGVRANRVAATANAGARVEVGATLADDDLACGNYLAAEALDAEVLGVRVTTVASGTRAFFMCHLEMPALKFWGIC